MIQPRAARASAARRPSAGRRRILATKRPRIFPAAAPGRPGAVAILRSVGSGPLAERSIPEPALSGGGWPAPEPSPTRRRPLPRHEEYARLRRAICYGPRMTARTWVDGEWHDGAPLLQGALTQSFMHGTTVFDGARAFARQAPDLDRHMARLLRSAAAMGLDTGLDETALVDLAVEGIRAFPPDAELYVRPALWAEDGFLVPEGRARFALTLFEVAMPAPDGLAICLSPFRRPAPDTAPTLAKASCLYPNTALALKDAAARGFDNAALRDQHDNVVELGTSNLWIARGGVAVTPKPNGTFLAGVTRARVAALLRDSGVEVLERNLSWADVLAADEAFSTGNLGKVLPIARVGHRGLQPGPLGARAREAYFAWAARQTV